MSAGSLIAAALGGLAVGFAPVGVIKSVLGFVLIAAAAKVVVSKHQYRCQGRTQCLEELPRLLIRDQLTRPLIGDAKHQGLLGDFEAPSLNMRKSRSSEILTFPGSALRYSLMAFSIRTTRLGSFVCANTRNASMKGRSRSIASFTFCNQ